MGVETLITAEELLEMGDIGPCELVRGELINMSPTGGKHGKIALKVGRLLGNYVEEHSLGTVCAAETGFLVMRDPDTVRAPDVSYIAKERIPPEGEPDGYWEFAPDLAVEVISPSDRWSKVEEKVKEWLCAETFLVWVINPKGRSVHIYRDLKHVQLLMEEDTLTGEEIVPGFSLPVAEIFV